MSYPGPADGPAPGQPADRAGGGNRVSGQQAGPTEAPGRSGQRALGAAGARPVPAAAAHDSLNGRKVLVVDDDTRNAFAITSILEAHGVRVVHAPDGRDALRQLQVASDIDLVLMDVMMPELDGYATTAAIREMPGLANLPVIAVTARAMQSDRDKSLAAGASDYVTKPVDTEELLKCMERWLTTGPQQG